jgi:phosphoribosylamine-glycine ligase
MKKFKIPTAGYQSFDNYDAARQYLDTIDAARVVIKVDGLAAGKGVVLPTS